MINEMKMKVLINGIKVKLSRGEDLDAILEGYVKLSEEEKEYVKKALTTP